MQALIPMWGKAELKNSNKVASHKLKIQVYLNIKYK